MSLRDAWGSTPDTEAPGEEERANVSAICRTWPPDGARPLVSLFVAREFNPAQLEDSPLRYGTRILGACL